MKILTAAQMQEIDRQTSELAGVPSLILMENAGFNLYRALSEKVPHLSERSIAIICGKGNNGGDGMVLARQLAQRGIQTDLFLLGSAAEVRGDAAVNLQILLKSGFPVFEVTSPEVWSQVAASLDVYDVLVDAILGTGMAKPLSGLYAQVVQDLNAAGAFVLAVDLPSGMAADSLEAAQLSVRADLTVTFTAPKIAHLLNSDQEAIGELVVAPIGTPPALLDRPDFTLNLLEPELFGDWLAPRLACSHKGTYGHVALIAGSRGKAGAAALSAYAALRAGSGLVTALVPQTVQPEVAGAHSEVMTEGLPADGTGFLAAEALEPIQTLLDPLDAAGVGPGLGTGPGTATVVEGLIRSARCPLVLDADALNVLAGRTDTLLPRQGPPLVLTPHPGEFARLAGLSVPEVLKRQLELVPEFARRHGVWLVLKTFRPLISDPEGICQVSPRGQAGMASAGMGDVLTGVLTSLLGRLKATAAELDPEAVTQVVCLAVYLHGLSGELAAQRRGEESLTAGDVIESLSDGWKQLKQHRETT
ncbi:MAG: NAD(P)H-hydrate dehydratase [Acidobacteriota bacterium]